VSSTSLFKAIPLWSSKGQKTQRVANAEQAQAMLRLFAQNTPIAMAVFDVEAKFLAVSDQWRADYGLVGADITGASFYDIMPEAARRWHSLFETCMADNQPMSSKDTFMRRDGRHQEMRWTLKPWHGSEDEVSGIVMSTEILSDEASKLDTMRLQNDALTSALSPMGLVDLQGRLGFGNNALASLLGYDQLEDLVGLRVMSLLVDPSKERSARESLVETGKWIDFVGIRRLDKEQRIVQIAANIVQGEHGEPVGVMVTCTDLTEQKKTERALSESRRQLVSLMDNLPGGFAFRCRDDLFWTMEIVSRGCRAVLGYEPDSLIDNLDVDFASLIHPDDEAQVRSEILQAVSAHRPFQLNYRVISRDGLVKWVMQQGTPIYTPDGEIEALEGVVIDITDRVEANRDLQVEKDRAEQYLDVASSIILALDRQGRVSRFNRKGTEVTGFTEAELAGLNWLDVMVMPEHEAEVRALISQLNYNEKRTAYIEINSLSKSGETLLIGWELAPISDAHGNTTGILVSGEDLTGQRDVERQLLQAQKMQAVGELTGGMAHDFNNLLMAVQGNLEFLKEVVGERADARKFIETALRAVGRGADLTRRLLAFSRKQLLRPEPTSINMLIADMTELIGRSLGSTVTVDIDLNEDVSIAMVDSAMLENALLNLSINARDAMPGGGTLRIESANRTIERGFDGQAVVLKPGDYVMVAVHDTGTGMPPDVLERVFEPFFSTKDTGKGTGLGLAMVYGFVKQSGGHIDIKSEVGEGTSVYLYLPCSRPGVAEVDKTPDPDEPVRGGSEMVLVVEDDPAVRDVIVRVLRGLGYDTHEAENAKLAKQMMRDGLRPEMLLTDIVQPQGINGIELADDTVQFDPDCAVLLMSGFSDEIFDLADDQALPYPLLTKPFGHDDLARKVRMILDDRVETNLEGSRRL